MADAAQEPEEPRAKLSQEAVHISPLQVVALNGAIFELSEAVTILLLRSVKLRSMIYLEDVCKQMSTPTNTQGLA